MGKEFTEDLSPRSVSGPSYVRDVDRSFTVKSQP